MSENCSLYYHDYYANMYSHSAFGYGELKGKGLWRLNIRRGVNNAPKRVSWRIYFGRLNEKRN